MLCSNHTVSNRDISDSACSINFCLSFCLGFLSLFNLAGKFKTGQVIDENNVDGR